MSINAALSNALSGLSANTRSAEVISANLSNALTEGYGRREIHLAPRWVGGNGTGVQVSGVTREVNTFAVSQRQFASGDLAFQGGRAQFFERLQATLGQPGQTGSLTMIINELETSLVQAASRPDSVVRLDGAVTSARSVSDKLNNLTGDVQDLRQQADSDIAAYVDELNSLLQQVHRINASIMANSASDAVVNRLSDQRQIALDRISEIVPVRTAERGSGQIAIYTERGAVLLDGPSRSLSFSPAGTITADMTVASGALDEITLGGQTLGASGSGPLSGGALGAAFEVRDVLATDVQSGLDALARDLIERFSGPSVDPTLAVGQEGLFVDTPVPFIPANEVGLAGRLAVNAQVDPNQSGDSWKLRDGIGAAVPGTVGNSSQLNALVSALTVQRSPSSGPLTSSAFSFGGHAGGLLSKVNADHTNIDLARDFAMAKHDTFMEIELTDGVDSDEQMQKLLLVERAFAANARVLQTADDMIQTLLGL